MPQDSNSYYLSPTSMVLYWLDDFQEREANFGRISGARTSGTDRASSPRLRFVPKMNEVVHMLLKRSDGTWDDWYEGRVKRGDEHTMTIEFEDRDETRRTSVSDWDVEYRRGQ